MAPCNPGMTVANTASKRGRLGNRSMTTQGPQRQPTETANVMACGATRLPLSSHRWRQARRCEKGRHHQQQSRRVRYGWMPLLSSPRRDTATHPEV